MDTTIAVFVVQLCLDYSNALLYDTLADNIHKLQCAQNSSLSCCFASSSWFSHQQTLLSLLAPSTHTDSM